MHRRRLTLRSRKGAPQHPTRPQQQPSTGSRSGFRAPLGPETLHEASWPEGAQHPGQTRRYPEKTFFQKALGKTLAEIGGPVGVFLSSLSGGLAGKDLSRSGPLATTGFARKVLEPKSPKRREETLGKSVFRPGLPSELPTGGLARKDLKTRRPSFENGL